MIFGPSEHFIVSQIWQRVGRKGTGLKGDRYLNMNPTVVEGPERRNGMKLNLNIGKFFSLWESVCPHHWRPKCQLAGGLVLYRKVQSKCFLELYGLLQKTCRYF